MNIPQNTAMKNRPKSARAAAVKYGRRVDQAGMGDWKHVSYTDPATGRVQKINVRHS